MKVSIIMPTYNVGNIVLDTIESVINQTHANWELIIVDDASTDNTQQILTNLAKKEPRIKLIFSETNMGAGVSRNIGLDSISGSYLAFLDADDIWEMVKLQKQIEYMVSLKATISHTSFIFINEKGFIRPGKVSASEVVDLEHNLRFTEIGTSTAMIDLNQIEGDVRFSEIRARQDLKLWIDLLSRGYVSHGLDIPLVKYRVRSGSVSSNKLKMLLITFKVYMGVGALPVYKRFGCYFSYVVNAIKKRS